MRTDLLRFASPILLSFSIAALGCGGATGATATPGDDASTTGDDGATATDDASTTPGDAATTDGAGDSSTPADAAPTTHLKTVFIIVLENHSWSDIQGSTSAPYINSLLSQGAYATNYKTPPNNHPSEPNYIWLEAGSNLGITTDNDPSSNHQSTKEHLVTQLENKGISWKSYQESIDGKTCPLVSSGLYGAKHNPMVFFDDVTNTNSASSKHCIDHVRPYSELATDLAAGTVARYNFITPNLCDDMHGQTFGTTCQIGLTDLIKKGDDWLKSEVPKILASNAWHDGGALFITWDEGTEPIVGNASDGPMGMIVLSPLAKVGHPSSIAYTHSSTLRTIETIFGVPFLRDAANATDLADMFTAFP